MLLAVQQLLTLKESAIQVQKVLEAKQLSPWYQTELEDLQLQQEFQGQQRQEECLKKHGEKTMLQEEG